MVEGIFASVELLQSLQEVDSKVDLLKLLTLTIEVVGDKAEPFLNRIATTLPSVSLSCPFCSVEDIYNEKAFKELACAWGKAIL